MKSKSAEIRIKKPIQRQSLDIAFLPALPENQLDNVIGGIPSRPPIGIAVVTVGARPSRPR